VRIVIDSSSHALRFSLATQKRRLAAGVTIPLDKHRVRLYISIRLYNLMVMDMASTRLDATFAALADPTRRAILARLASGEASVKELAEPFRMSQPAISKHLKVLQRAGLISRGRDAQRRPRRLEAEPLGKAAKWLERYRRYWEGNFKRLDDLLAELRTKEKKRGRKKRNGAE